MPWEESRRKEQIFRKSKINREAVLKTVEDEEGKTTLVFSLKNDTSITEISLTIDEWKAILSFLNRTSEQILSDLGHKIATAIAEPIATPILEPIATPTEEIMISKKISEKIQVSDEEFSSLEAEMQKIIPVAVSDVPVVRSEDVIREVNQPFTEIPEVDEQIPLDEETPASIEQINVRSPTENLDASIPKLQGTSEEENTDLDSTATEIHRQKEVEIPESYEEEPVPEEEMSIPESYEEMSVPEEEMSIPESYEEIPVPEEEMTSSEMLDIESGVDSDIEKILEPDFEDQAVQVPALPQIPKISLQKKEDVQSLLTPIQKPKIHLGQDIEPEAIPSQISSSAISESASVSPASAEVVRDSPNKMEELPDITDLTDLDDIKEVIIPGSVDGSPLSESEKEAKILAAMEEVAALMPPGPAKRFVEEMMLKRAAETDHEKPRIPQRNNINNQN